MTERSMGESSHDRTEAYKAWETLTVGEKVYEGTVYHLCDNLGTKGLSVGEWNVDISYEVTLSSMTPRSCNRGNVLMRLSTSLVPEQRHVRSAKRGRSTTASYALRAAPVERRLWPVHRLFVGSYRQGHGDQRHG